MTIARTNFPALLEVGKSISAQSLAAVDFRGGFESYDKRSRAGSVRTQPVHSRLKGGMLKISYAMAGR